MYKIELRRLAQRALDKLPPREFSAVLETVKDLADTPRPRGVEKIKSAGLWRARDAAFQAPGQHPAPESGAAPRRHVD